MYVSLTEEQVTELVDLISSALRDLSHEIAATENPGFRARLLARRQILETAARRLDDALSGLEELPRGS